MNLTIITGRQKKFEEAQKLIPSIKWEKIDLEEIQSMDYLKVAEHKLTEASKLIQGNIIIDDAGVELECLKGFPGTYAKDFINTIGFKQIPIITEKLGNNKAKITCTLGLRYNGENYFFQGIVEGRIMAPKLEEGFDYDLIFAPKDYERPFAELPFEIKMKESHRTKAYEKLIEFLKQKDEQL